MTEFLYHKLIADLSELKFRGTIIFGPWSEPLLDERLAGFVKYAKAKLSKSQILLQTNGDMLTPEKFEELHQAGIEHIDVSDHYRKEGTSYVIDEPKQALLTYQQLDKTKKKNIHFHKLNSQRIRRIEPFHNRSGLVPLNNTICHEILYKRCFLAESTMAVKYDGRFALCCRQWVDQPTFGNIGNENIKDIWNNPGFKKIRMSLRQGIFELELCRKCGYGYLPEAH